MSGAHRVQNAPAEAQERTRAKRKRPKQNRKGWRTSSANRRDRTADTDARQAQPPRQNRRRGCAPSALRQNHRCGRTPSANRPGRTADTDARQAQTAPTEPQIRMRTKRNHPSRTAMSDARRAQNIQTARININLPRRVRIPHSEFRIPPRAQTPVPALKPAGRSVAPAHNPLSHRAEYRFFASARSGVCGRKARRSYSYAEQETP